MRRITSIIDALYLESAQTEDTEVTTLQMMYGTGEEHAMVMQAVSHLQECLRSTLNLKVLVDFEETNLPSTSSFDVPFEQWSKTSIERLATGSQCPAALQEISKAVDNRYLSWTPVQESLDWIGRIDGLQVLRINEDGHGVFEIRGEPRAQRIVLDLLEEGANFTEGDTFEPEQVDGLVDCLKQIIDSRLSGRLSECALHDRVRYRLLSGITQLKGLTPICADFPCIWTDKNPSHRPIDLLLGDGERPVVAQVEVGTGGRIQDNFRHAIIKAALGRYFIRQAKFTHSWFGAQGLDPKQCQALVAFPKLTSARARSRLNDLEKLAQAFDVEIRSIRGSIA